MSICRIRVSSSSSTETSRPEDRIATLLAHAFELMQSDAPGAYAEMARRLGRSTVRIAVDDDIFDVRVEHDVPRVRDPHDHATVSVRTSRATVRDVLAGRRTLAGALRADELRAEGRASDLVAVLEALEAFVHGAVRCDAVAQLYHDFQRERVA
jgi:hypothetical protein